ncbi:MAG: hypothetical protein K6T78_07930 [Alicyclobacillus sp.]|nr:hypothetical protein [Alicyclobacillus sp.]
MQPATCRPGDVLFYFDADGLTRLIEVGESLEEHSEGPWPYHVAIALGPEDKLEADFWDTVINPIQDGRPYVVCRPPYPNAVLLAQALHWGRGRVGRLYGWVGIVDQALRDISGGRLHLPRWLIKRVDRLMPYCSTLVQSVLARAGVDIIPDWPPPSPADVWIALRDYAVYDGRKVGGH